MRGGRDACRPAGRRCRVSRSDHHRTAATERAGDDAARALELHHDHRVDRRGRSDALGARHPGRDAAHERGLDRRRARVRRAEPAARPHQRHVHRSSRTRSVSATSSISASRRAPSKTSRCAPRDCAMSKASSGTSRTARSAASATSRNSGRGRSSTSPISSTADIDRARNTDRRDRRTDHAGRSLARDGIIAAPEVWGVETFTLDTVTIRLVVKTAPHEQWRGRARAAHPHQDRPRRRRHRCRLPR